ncbi:MAG: thioredoxin family protein [Steroidobacterales bacterium]
MRRVIGSIVAARADHNDVLLVFGANWCPDCRELGKALNGSSHALISGHFQVVKVDVGRFDKNLDLANQYGNPIKMGDTGIYDFLSSHVAQGH